MHLGTTRTAQQKLLASFKNSYLSSTKLLNPEQHLNNKKGAINIKTKSLVSQKRHGSKAVTIYKIQSVFFLVGPNKKRIDNLAFLIFLFYRI